MKRILSVVITIIVFISNSHAASFDCKKAVNTVENIICSSDELAMLDLEIATEYKQALGVVSKKEEIINEQRNWLNQVRNKCLDFKCIYIAYTDRLKQIISLRSKPELLYKGCDAESAQCNAEAISFEKQSALEAMKRLENIYSSYGFILTETERNRFKEDQEKWLQLNLMECNSRQEEVDKWSCLRWARDQRSVELDKLIKTTLDINGIMQRSNFTSLNLLNKHVMVSGPISAQYSVATDKFDIAKDVDGIYDFSFAVVGSNGHICSGAGKAKRNNNLFTRIADQLIGNNQAMSNQEKELLNRSCKFEIKLFRFHIEFEGNRECHEYFLCGARAAPNGTFFFNSKIQ